MSTCIIFQNFPKNRRSGQSLFAFPPFSIAQSTDLSRFFQESSLQNRLNLMISQKMGNTHGAIPNAQREIYEIRAFCKIKRLFNARSTLCVGMFKGRSASG
jgi:hypothetical protein